MKMGRPHAVPLSRQAIAIVREIEHDAEYSNFLFPSLRAPDRPMSDNTINAALRRLGYPRSGGCGGDRLRTLTREETSSHQTLYSL